MDNKATGPVPAPLGPVIALEQEVARAVALLSRLRRDGDALRKENAELKSRTERLERKDAEAKEVRERAAALERGNAELTRQLELLKRAHEGGGGNGRAATELDTLRREHEALKADLSQRVSGLVERLERLLAQVT